jgi:hypothetical protein
VDALRNAAEQTKSPVTAAALKKASAQGAGRSTHVQVGA